jgi:multiple sugar transport system substrate-binding protein
MEQQPTRRAFLAGAAGAGAALALGPGATSALAGTERRARRKATQLTFTTWTSPAEAAAYKTIIKAFQAKNAGITVKLEQVPYATMNQGIDARLQAGKAPDLFRTTYNDLGFYGKQGGLSDLSTYFSKSFAARFTPSLWAAVTVAGKPFGVPQHTDVSALVYNKSLFAKAGIKKVPTSLATAWTWEEFLDVARAIKTKTGAYGFAMNWQLFGAYRWMTFLYEAGGTMLDASGKPTLSSPAGQKTLAFFKTWADEKLYPANAQPKGPAYPDELFPAGKIGMIFAGDFLIPSLADGIKKFQWGVTYMPRGKTSATDLGGTAVVASKDAKDPEAAAKFLDFLVTDANQRLFCEKTGTLPTLKSLTNVKLKYAVRPDVMPVYVKQATTLPTRLVQEVSIPGFTEINNAMVTQLEAFLVSGQSATTTLKNMDSAVAKATKG